MRGSKAKRIKHRHESKQTDYFGRVHKNVLCNDGVRRDRIQIVLGDCGRLRYKVAKKIAKAR